MSYLIKDMPVSERPREKLLSKGVKALSDSELLAIVLKNGTKSKSVNQLALELLRIYGSLHSLSYASVEELESISGIGVVKAMEVVASLELGRRMMMRDVVRVSTGEDVYQLFYSKMSGLVQEELHVVFLDTKQQVMKTQMIFRGTVNASNVHPRDVWREAFKVGAVRIILVHNHPSGDVTPSGADVEFTKVMQKMGKELGVEVIDHVIIGHNSYYSFYDNNWWDCDEEGCS